MVVEKTIKTIKKDVETLKQKYERKPQDPGYEEYAKETRYLRENEHTINGETSYELGLTQSSSCVSLYDGLTGEEDSHSWGVRVFLRHADNSTLELTSGTQVAIVTRTTNGYGIQSAQWTCPETDIESTDALEIWVYGRFPNYGAWGILADFITIQLGSERKKIKGTWTFYYWTYREYPVSGNTETYFKFGKATCNSRIEDVLFLG